MERAPLEEIRITLGDLSEVLPELELVVLFGSAAKGRMRPRSDVDLAVSCMGAADLDSLYLALAPRLGTDRLDLVDLRRASPLLMMEVARSGRPLYEEAGALGSALRPLATKPAGRS
jgi:predicted nucleotidyltransferase